MMSICKYINNDGLCLLHSDPLYKEPCHEGPCHDYTAMTNVDRIRAMTDRELAVLLQNSCCRPDLTDCPEKIDDCEECWLDWLKQEAGNE